MNEETEALAYSQLLLFHADTITDSGVKEMVVNSAAELTILQLRVEALRLENERLREALDRSLTDEQIRQIAASIDRSMPLESAKILFARRIEAALRREEVKP